MDAASQRQFAKPEVTVVCITYRHEEYIAQALDSFLMQKTSFPFKIFVGEDNGPDKTADIVREYAKKYPDKIVPFLRTENMGAQRNLVDMCQKAESKYIAFCEGDDYWIDECKLQKQYDLMEAHPEYRACFAETQILADESWYLNGYYKPNADGIRTIPGSIPGYDTSLREMKMDYYIKYGAAHTSSMFFRWNYKLQIPEWYYTHLYGDHPMMMMQVGNGILGYIPEVMSVYRRSDVGVLMNDDIISHFINTRESWIEVAEDLERYFSEHYGDFAHKAICDRIITEFINYVNFIFKRGDTDALPDIVKKHPHAAAISMDRLIRVRRKYLKIYTKYTKKQIDYIISNPKNVKPTLKKGVKKIADRAEKTRLKKIRRFNSYNNVAKDDKLWAFVGDKNSFYGNCRHLFEWVLAYHPEIHAVWVTHSDEVLKLFKSENIECYKSNTKSSNRIFKKAKYVVTNDPVSSDLLCLGMNRGNRFISLNLGNSFLAPKHRKFFKNLEEDEPKNAIVSAKNKTLDLRTLYKDQFYVVPNADFAGSLKSLGFKDDKIMVCGNPRTYAVPTCGEEFGGKTVLVAFHERPYAVQNQALVQWMIENLETIEKYAERDNYTVKLHLIDNIAKKFGEALNQQVKSFERISIATGDRYTNISKYSAIITDYADIAADFLQLDKPVISLIFGPEMKKSKFLYPYAKSVAPVSFFHWAEALQQLNDEMSNQSSSAEFRKEARQLLFKGCENTPKNSEKIVEFIKSID